MKDDNLFSKSQTDKKIISNARMGKIAGVGNNPALLVIDAQNYMVGLDENQDNSHFPSGCGQSGWDALKEIKKVSSIFRQYAMPIFYSRMILDKEGRDM